jgi:phage gpG-like protein
MIFHISDNGTARIVAERLNESGVRAMEIEPVMMEIIKDMMRITALNFSSGGRRGGGSWAKLKPDTVKRKKGDARILRDTDALYRSVTEPDAPYQILKLEPTGFQFGTSRPYAHVHQRGSSAAKIPARPFLRFLLPDEARWRDMLANHILKPFTRTSGGGPFRGE